MRTKKSIYNFISDVIPFIILGVLSFLRINYIIKYYGEDTNGYMQLITQIFSYLALAEAGFGTAVIYKLYKPLADNDQKKISSIVNGSKIIFKKIALVMSILSITCAIVIPFFINRGSLTIFFIIAIFLLNSIHYLIEYFIVYPYTSLLQADQNQYIFNLYKNIIKIIFGVLELILMRFRIDLMLIIGINILFTLIYIYMVMKRVKKLYPWLDNTSPPDTTAFKMTKDVMVHKISYLVFSKTDPIILSKFSLGYVSLYTSYNYIIDFITNIVSKIYNSIRASYCNIVVLGKNEDKKYFNMFLSFSFFTACFACVTFNTTVNPFVNILWLGKEYQLSKPVVLLFTLIMFGKIIVNPIYIARDSKGLYKETKNFTILQAITNIVLSIILVQKYQIFGVLLATFLSQYLIMIPLNISTVYSKVFKNDIKIFIKKFLFAIINSIILVTINAQISKILDYTTVPKLIIFMVVVGCINLTETTGIYYILDKDFKLLINQILGKIIKKR